MSKRTLESEIGETSTQILTNLSPDERIQLMLDAMAEDRESHVERLIKSTPVKTYDISDLDVRDRHHTALLMALGASKELEVGMWQFHYARLEGLYHTQLAHEFDVDDWDFIEEPSSENDFLEEKAMDAAARFLRDYLAWEQFVEQVFGLGLEQFLSLATPGGCIDAIGEMANLADGRAMDEIDGADDELEERDVGWAAGRTVEYDGEQDSVEEAAERKAEELVQAWTTCVKGKSNQF